MNNCKAKNVLKCVTEEKMAKKKLHFIFTSEHTWISTALTSEDSV